MPQQAGPRWHSARRCWRARFPGSEYQTNEISEKDQVGAYLWYVKVKQDYERRQQIGVTRKESLEPGDFGLRTICLRYLTYMLEEVEEGKRPKRSLADTRVRLTCFFRHSQLADCPLSELTATKFTAVFDQPEILKLSPAYRASVWSAVQAALNWAAKPVANRVPERLIKENPIKGAASVSVPRVNKYIESRELRKFFRRCWGLARAQTLKYQRQSKLTLIMIRLLGVTGTRPSELRSLLWSDIDWKARQIVLPWDRHKTGKKTKLPRTIYLTNQAVRILRFMEQQGVSASGHVFTTLRGTPWDISSFGLRIRKWKQKLGVKIRLNAYSFRHAYCSEALSNGASLTNVAKLVGNSPVTLQKSYDHAINSKLAAEAEEIAKLRRRL